LDRIVDAAAALQHAIAAAGYYPRLYMAEMLITINAAQLATAHDAAALSHSHRAAGLPPNECAAATVAGRAAPAAWKAARTHCASFDDDTKLRPPDGSPIAAAAARFRRGLPGLCGPASRAGPAAPP